MPNVSVRLLREEELDAADRIVRMAFGTFLELPDPMSFMGDASFVHSRWRADPTCAFAADVDGGLAATAIVTRWGSVGYFGPVAVLPEHWNAGIAQHLLHAIVRRFAEWGVSNAGLYTFSNSTRHVHLYQKFDFWPRFLTALMSRPAGGLQPSLRWSTYSSAAEGDRPRLLAACRALTETIYPGLDLSLEITAAAAHSLGDTLLLWDGDDLAGFAVCQHGPGTEGGSGNCFVKFGAVRPGDGEAFAALLAACDAYAVERGLQRVSAGVNMSHHEAYRAVLTAGFRTDRQGVIMQRANEQGYHQPGIYVLDDWR